MLLWAALPLPAAFAADAPGVEDNAPGLQFSVETRNSVTTGGDVKMGSVRFGELSSSESALSVSAGFAVGAADRFSVGVSGDGIFFDHDLPTTILNTQSPLPERLQRVALDFSWTHRLNDQWSSLVSVSPGFSWADSRLSWDALGAKGVVGFHYRASPELGWVFGVAYDTLSRDLPVLPVLGLTWNPAAEWTVAVGFPKTAVTYNFSPKLSLGLAAEGQGGTYHVERDPWQDPLFGGVSHVLDESKIEYLDVRLGLEFGYRFSERGSLTATVGTVLFREAEYHKSHVRLSKIKSDDQTLFGSLGVKLAF